MKKIYLILKYLASYAEPVIAIENEEDAYKYALELQQENDNASGMHDTGMSSKPYRFAVQPIMVKVQ